jgi:hypothetical protein
VLGQVGRLAQREACRRDLLRSELGVLDELRRRLGSGDEGSVAGDRVFERERLERGGLEEALSPLDGAKSGEVVDRGDARGLASMQPSQAARIGRLLDCRWRER